MVSIPHFEDMSPQRIYDSLDISRWTVSEKLDGSYVKFGLDQDGVYFTERKGGQRFYTLEDFPEECWADTYKIAHTALGFATEAMKKEGFIKLGQEYGAEVVQGFLPNTVPYKIDTKYDGTIHITSAENPSHLLFSMMGCFECSFIHEALFSIDGWNIEREKRHQTWAVKMNPRISNHWITARLQPHADQLKNVLDSWFPLESKISGFTIKEILEIKLNKKHPNCGNRNWTDLKEEISKERDELRVAFTNAVLLFKRIAEQVLIYETPSVIGAGSLKEGMVIETSDGLFKITERELFTEANLFTHIVKYWLVGGRRPYRPSFLSRTKDWPIDKKLARLDQLRTRFLTNHYQLNYILKTNGRSHLYSYSGQLRERTLNMFRDTRKRIEDGR